MKSVLKRINQVKSFAIAQLVELVVPVSSDTNSVFNHKVVV